MSNWLFLVLRCQIRWWSRTTPRCPCTSWWRTPTRPSASTTRLSTTFASAPWNWPLPTTATWTTWCRRPCPAWPPAFAFRASWTRTCANWPSTWSPSLGCTFSCRASRRWPRAAPKHTAPCPCPSWRSRCSTRRTWWRRVIHVTGATSPWRPSSEGAWAWRRSTTTCWMCRTKIAGRSYPWYTIPIAGHTHGVPYPWCAIPMVYRTHCGSYPWCTIPMVCHTYGGSYPWSVCLLLWVLAFVLVGLFDFQSVFTRYVISRALFDT